MNIPLFTVLRRVNGVVKKARRARAGRVVSVCRRVERVCLPGRRVCAMTFDDGPTRGLTEGLLDTLAAFGARATFDVIGSTAENYPDEPGEVGTHFVFGTRYDHYACFGQDSMAGAAACPDLVRRIAREGHELANHGYRHIIFGPSRAVYRPRVCFGSIDEVLADLRRLHALIKELTGKDMTLARPPHYVDNIPGGKTAYDAYAAMGYNYMAASFDGGGWLPSGGDYAAYIEGMVRPLRAALERDPLALSGAIVFQKDGYNMSRRAPIAEALPLQLALLREYGYEVVSVSELLALSPFEDTPPDDPAVAPARRLLAAGRPVAYKNNTLHPGRDTTWRELSAMTGLPAPRCKLTPASLAAFAATCGAPPCAPSDITRRSALMAMGN
jgi:peptidoglycan/xylan/chitin deacetylase (PgdA/CDA1 family)